MSKQPEALMLARALEGESIPWCRSDVASELRRLHAANAELVEALRDMNEGWKYIRQVHGDLYGVGWDRAQDKADAALSKHKEQAR
jgi:hypothetical protein